MKFAKSEVSQIYSEKPALRKLRSIFTRELRRVSIESRFKSHVDVFSCDVGIYHEVSSKIFCHDTLKGGGRQSNSTFNLVFAYHDDSDLGWKPAPTVADQSVARKNINSIRHRLICGSSYYRRCKEDANATLEPSVVEFSSVGSTT